MGSVCPSPYSPQCDVLQSYSLGSWPGYYSGTVPRLIQTSSFSCAHLRACMELYNLITCVGSGILQHSHDRRQSSPFMTTPTSFLHPHPDPTPTLSVLSNFVIAEMSYEWSHPVCKLWGVTFIHIAYIPWDPSQLSKSVIHPQRGWTRVCLTFTR